MNAIAEGKAPAKDENGQSWRGRQDVIYNASKIFDVCERTVEEAVARYPEEAFFTNGSKLRAMQSIRIRCSKESSTPNSSRLISLSGNRTGRL
jgi:hypothetical protein